MAETDLSQIVSEISRLTGWNESDVERETLAESQHPGQHVKDAWRQSAPATQDDIDSFYQSTTSYIFDLMVESAREVRQAWRQSVIDFLDSWWGGASSARLIDYGAGVGTDTIAFAERCRAAYYYDLPGATSDFASKRFIARGSSVRRIADTTSYRAEFDALVSFEVLEHLTDPTAALDEMVRLVRRGGLLFLTESFDLVTDDYPSHLASNQQFAGKLDEMMAARGCQPVALLEERIHVYSKGQPLTVIVPVYNAHDHVTRLLASISATSPGYPVKWLFVNDASPDQRIAPLLDAFAADAAERGIASEVVHSPANRGFVQTCNYAMEASAPNDVILLNSDTIVYDGWARKLVQTAYDDPRIGTTTPLSNNASCFSVFQHAQPDNQLNRMLGIVDVQPIDIPVGVGFCLFIKREVLDRVGYFDSVFGKGYGEETDLCLRATQAGYRHVLAPSGFVFHAGSASMMEANIVQQGETTIQEHEDIIAKRYPDFVPAVHRYIASGATERLDSNLSRRYLSDESPRRPSIAFVVHDDPFSSVVGGVTYHIRDVMRELGSEFMFYFITPHASDVSIVGYADGVADRTVVPLADLAAALADLRPSVAHIHHLMNFDPSAIDALIDWTVPKVFTIHDYYGVCPQYTLLNDHHVYCGIPGPEACGMCAEKLFGSDYAAIMRHRAVYQRLADSCALVIGPSQTAVDVFRKAITVPESKTQVIPHASVVHKYREFPKEPFVSKGAATSSVVSLATLMVDAGAASTEQGAHEDAQAAPESRNAVAGATVSLPEAKRTRVGVIGYNSIQKGSAILRGIVAACAHDPIDFISFGEMGEAASQYENVFTVGRYTRDTIVDLIRSANLDLMVIPSIWPETFAYTLSETWQAGVPVVVGPLGAQAERTKASGAGVVVADFEATTFAHTIKELAAHRQRLADLKSLAAQVVISECYDAYRALYLSLSGGRGRQTLFFSATDAARMTHVAQIAMGDAPTATPIAAPGPLIAGLVAVRKRLIPVGSRRERIYFWAHNLISRNYAGSISR